MTPAKTIAQTVRKIAKRLFDRRIISAHGPMATGQSIDPHSILSRLERLSANATLLILAGILVEIAFILYYPHDIPTIISTVVANGAIGIGLVIEYFCILGAIVASEESQRLSDEKIATANARADEANAEAAKANAASEDLKRKNLDVEAALSPRVLEQSRSASRLSRFTGILFRVISPSDFETRRTAGQIRFALGVANWGRYTRKLTHDFPFFDGVVIHMLGITLQSKLAAEELVTILTENKIAARLGYPLMLTDDKGSPDLQGTQAMSSGARPAALIIEVGPKPLPASMALTPAHIPQHPDERGRLLFGNITEDWQTDDPAK